MKRYANIKGTSGVEKYQTGSDFIRLQFVGSDQIYTYSYASAGKRHVEKMKKLAEVGEGLSTYVSRHVHDQFEK